MEIYQVLENGKPACYPKVPSWCTNKFLSLEEAAVYANNWLGPSYGPIQFELNVPYDYNGYDDVLMINCLNYNEEQSKQFELGYETCKGLLKDHNFDFVYFKSNYQKLDIIVREGFQLALWQEYVKNAAKNNS